MNLSRTLRTLGRGIKLAARVAKAKLAPDAPARGRQTPAPASRMVTVSGFGDNPGRLRMLAYLPPDVAGRPLVVLLHGCGQKPPAFAADTGWTMLADRLRVPLILPEQMEANNAARCFQWFHPSDTRRDAGEAGSIAAMTRAAITRFESDPRRVFVVGLSAGGAMAVAMLAAYPDLFAAGASVAGLPVGAAQSAMQAILRMASASLDQAPETLAKRVRAAAPAGFAGPWPRLSIWQGLADRTVAPDNARLLARQWRAVHGLNDATFVETVHDGVQHRSWSDGSGPQVELWSLPLMPHGYPVGRRIAKPASFMHQAPVDATASMARFFGLD